MITFLYFFIFSFFGFILETIFTIIKAKKFQIRKTMKSLPLCPVYGIAAILLNIFSPLMKTNIISCFLFGFIICSLVEYAYNSIARLIFNVTVWDYSNIKWNLDGNICLKFSFYWGLISTIFIYYINPFMYQIITNFSLSIAIFLFGLTIFDTIGTIEMLIKKNFSENYCPVYKIIKTNSNN